MSEKLEFGELVRKISKELPNYPRTIPGRMIYISFNGSQLAQFNALLDKWRQEFKSVSEAQAIIVAFKWMLMSVANEDEIDEE